ncbi:MAG: hypothetical protein ACYDAD_11345 [Acidimicrobiales bacterium]
MAQLRTDLDLFSHPDGVAMPGHVERGVALPMPAFVNAWWAQARLAEPYAQLAELGLSSVIVSSSAAVGADVLVVAG